MQRTPVRLIAAFASLILLGAACSSGGDGAAPEPVASGDTNFLKGITGGEAAQQAAMQAKMTEQAREKINAAREAANLQGGS